MFSAVLLLPLDVESSGNADRVGGTPPIVRGEETCMVEGSGKEKGSDGHTPCKAGGVYSGSKSSESAFQRLLDGIELVKASSLSVGCCTSSASDMITMSR